MFDRHADRRTHAFIHKFVKFSYAKRIYTRNRSNNANLNKTVSKENSNNQQQRSLAKTIK